MRRVTWTLKGCLARNARDAKADTRDHWPPHYEAASEDRAQLLVLVDTMELYLSHQPGCHFGGVSGLPCDCGLAELQAKLEAKAR